MADLEKVHIKLGLSGTYWGKKPQYRITFCNQVLKEGSIEAATDVVEYHEFDVDYSDESVTLSVELLNKEDSDTVQSEDKTAILQDMLLNIVSLEIDEIDLGQIVFNSGTYTTKNPVTWNNQTTQTIKNCTNLGWNGIWALSWNNPFYIWLLESM